MFPIGSCATSGDQSLIDLKSTNVKRIDTPTCLHSGQRCVKKQDSKWKASRAGRFQTLWYSSVGGTNSFWQWDCLGAMLTILLNHVEPFKYVPLLQIEWCGHHKDESHLAKSLCCSVSLGGRCHWVSEVQAVGTNERTMSNHDRTFGCLTTDFHLWPTPIRFKTKSWMV